MFLYLLIILFSIMKLYKLRNITIFLSCMYFINDSCESSIIVKIFITLILYHGITTLLKVLSMIYNK